MFDRCKPTTLEGEINSVEWANPHIVIYVRTVDVDNYRVEWSSPYDRFRSVAQPVNGRPRFSARQSTAYYGVGAHPN